MTPDKDKMWKKISAEGLPFGLFCGTAMVIV